MQKSQPILKIFLAALIVALSVCLRVHALDVSSYWIDEMVSVNLAKHPLWASVYWDNSPPLYHLLLKFWVRFFGTQESATRALSVVFSSMTTVIMLRLGYFLRKWTGAFLFGLLHALSTLSIVYAQETRMYAMFEFFVALNLYLFFQILLEEKVNALREFAFCFCAVLMGLVHYLSVIPLSIEASILIFYRRKLAINVLFLAFFVETASYLNFFKWEGLGWQKLKFTAEPFSRWPKEILWELSNRSWLYAAGCVLLLVLAVKKPKRETSILLILTFVPLALMFDASLFLTRSVFLPRYFIYLGPSFVALLGISFVDIDQIGSKVKYVLLILMALGSAYALPKLYLPSKEPWRDVASLVAKYPSANLILTTRTTAIAVPYFESLGVTVQKWQPLTDVGLRFLKEQIAIHKKIWIIENYWGGAPYMPELAENLQKMNYQVSELSMRTDYSSPVLVMLIEEKEK